LHSASLFRRRQIVKSASIGRELPAPLCGFPKRRRAATLLAVVASKARIKTFGPAHFINRELSWLEFNHR
jgi:hypothetical protein